MKRMGKIIKLRYKIVFVLILILQAMYMFYWGTQKSGYYVDEFFTYDNTHYISASTPERVKLYDADFMEYGKWFDVSELKSTLTVERDESLLQDSLQDNIKAFLKWPYMAVLNYVEAVLFDGQMNWWSALSVNMICFLINQVIMYLIVRKLEYDEKTAFIAMALYGVSGMAISMFIYVRMYMWLTFLTSIFTYLHVLMWKEQCWWKNVLYEILAMGLLFILYKNSPLPVLYGVALIACFTIGLCVRKCWMQIGYYSVPIFVIGIAYAALKTDYISILKNPAHALTSGNTNVSTQALLTNMLSLNLREFITRLQDFIQMVSQYLFGHFFILIFYFALSCLFIWFIFSRGEKRKKTEEKCNKCLKFEIIIWGAIFSYMMASIIFRLNVIRYNSFIYPEISIVVVMLIAYLSRYVHKEKVFIWACCIALAGEIFYTASVPRIENLYREDREGINTIRQYKGIDSVVIDYKWDDRVMYECLAYTDEATKVMFVKYGDIEYSNLEDTLLVWQSVNESEDILQELLDAGYTYITGIAQTHESRVYLCKR